MTMMTTTTQPLTAQAKHHKDYNDKTEQQNNEELKSYRIDFGVICGWLLGYQ